MHLDAIVGSPAAPAGRRRTSRLRRAELLVAAQASSGCATPIIALNEMAGQDSATPWSAGTTAYRANILALVTGADHRRRAARSCSCPARRTRRTSRATPRVWWQQPRDRSRTSCSRSTRPAPKIYRRARCSARARCASRSARRCSRSSRSACRPARLGVMLGFQSGIGYAGARGPAADRQLARGRQARGARGPAGRGASSGSRRVWSWGWGTFAARAAPTPTRRSPRAPTCGRAIRVLCDAARPGRRRLRRLARRGADPARRRACSARSATKDTITTAAIDRLARLARGRQAAIGALLVRDLVTGRKATQLAIRRQEAAIVYARFNSSRGRYVACARARAARRRTSAGPRSPTGCKLQTVERGLHVPAPTAAAVRGMAQGARRHARARRSRARSRSAGSATARRGIALPGTRRAAAGAARARRADAPRADAAGHRAHHGRRGAAAAQGGRLPTRTPSSRR